MCGPSEVYFAVSPACASAAGDCLSECSHCKHNGADCVLDILGQAEEEGSSLQLPYVPMAHRKS